MTYELENIRLMLVDDEDGFRKAIGRRMSKRGLNPNHARSGEECLSFLENREMHVIVMDVKMPGINGLETLNIVKEKYPRTEVILLTGNATTCDGVNGIKVGAFDYLSKPVEFEHLINKIKQAYEKILREEEKKKNAELKVQMEQQMIVTERLASLGTLSTGVAHEINNPLAIIKESAGFMRMVLNKDELKDIPRKEHLEKALDKIEIGVNRAKRITHQLLGFVKKQEPVYSETNLEELVKETIELIAKNARDKGIVFVRDIESSGIIWSDAYQIRQVLLNLFTNAIHAINTNGTITILLQDTETGVSLSVKDTGKGIPKENLSKIFEPFFTTNPPDMGTGLGLHVTRGIIEKLEGTIEVESKVGHGTSFIIKLPKSDGIKENKDENKNIISQILCKIKGENKDG